MHTGDPPGESQETNPLVPGPNSAHLIAGRWRLTHKIGSGSFGEVFMGVNVKEEKAPYVAIKVEVAKKRNPHLIYEAKLMQLLEGGVGVPCVFHYGCEHGYNLMVIDLLGPSLEELFDECGRRFSLKTTLQLIEMMLCRIEFVHSRFIIHRDIKPHNFLMGRGKLDRLVHIIDFGLAKKYRDAKTLDHIPYKEGKTLTGTARYVSINTHVGIEQSRRDDMESLAYVFIYFVKGQLPWQSLKATSKKEKYQKIKEMKQNREPPILCQGLPKEFGEYLSYCRLLRFTERPDYSFCRTLFRDLFFREQYPNDFLFDWSSNGAVNDRDISRRLKLRDDRTGHAARRLKTPAALHTPALGAAEADELGEVIMDDILATKLVDRSRAPLAALEPSAVRQTIKKNTSALDKMRTTEQLYDYY